MEQACGNSKDCFLDIQSNCLNNQDHKQNKSCILYESYSTMLDIDQFFEPNAPPQGQKDFKSPKKIQQITEESGIQMSSEIKSKYTLQLQQYTADYNTWSKNKSQSNRKTLYATTQKFSIEIWNQMQFNSVFPSKYHIAGIECTSDCAKRLANQNAQQFYSKQLKCYGDRPSGESIDGSTKEQKGGAKQDSLQEQINKEQKKKQQQNNSNQNSSIFSLQFNIMILSILCYLIL